MHSTSTYPMLSKITIIFLSILITIPALGQNGIAINEMMSSNLSTLADEDGDFEDWIEIYNYSDSIVDISGWGLSDDYEKPFKWIFPETKIKPDEYLLVWASGKNRTLSPLTHKVIIPEQSVWRYLDDGSNQETFWREPEFDDSTWSSGPGMLGYDTNRNTIFGAEISFGSNSGFKHVTYYFRHNFEINDVENLEELELKLMIDDGAVVYINGQEMVRRNMPDGLITYTTFANVIVGTLDISYHQIPASILVDGNNTIAVEVHQCNRTSSDVRFDLELFVKSRHLHTNFSISSAGEEVLLTHPHLGLVDEILPISLPTDVSIGRWPNGTGDFGYYSTATPGEDNPEERFFELLSAPIFSHAAGFYADPFDLSITSSDTEVSIVYTLDGSEPDLANLDGKTFVYKNSFPGSMLTSSFQSLLYDAPIYLEDITNRDEHLATFASDYNGTRYTSTTNRLYKATVIRARAFKDGAVASPDVTHSYFFTPNLHNRYTVPVLSITTQPDNLFDYYTGIYTPGVVWDTQANGTRDGGAPANYNRRGFEWERPAHLEFFDGVANPVISQKIGMRTHGGWSRAHSMKSLRLYARGSYGEDYFNHRIFPDLPYQQYKRFMLRNSGNDFGRVHFLDAAAQAIVSELRFDTQAYRPIVLFLNGEYWGIHNIRERYDKYYLNRVYGVDENNVDLLEVGSGPAKEGDMVHYFGLTAYLENNNIAINSHYEYVKTLIDVDNFMDYQIAQIYIANTDWPGNNNDYWRLRTDGYQPYSPYGHDGRWRWLLFDTDFGFGGSNNAFHNTLNFATNPNGPSWPNPPHSTLILRRLLLNTTFRNDFITRFADLLNTHFAPDRANAIINQMRDNLDPEMPEHILRWGRPWSMNGWLSEVSKMNTFVNARPAQMRQHLQNHFNLSGFVNLTVNVSDTSHGCVRVNSINLDALTPGVDQQPYPWSGVYFQNVPIEMEAVSKPGYVFSHWEGMDEKFSPLLTKSFTNTSVSIKANFKPSDALHQWHFNNLPIDSVNYIEANHSNGATGVITYPGIGNGFMDRVDPGTLLNTTDWIVAGYGLRVRNPSDTRELLIEAPTTGFYSISFSFATMRTANGATFQEVEYRTIPNGPWHKLDATISVEEDWKVHRFNFPTDAVNDNPYFAVRILFKGAQAANESGNNRFDNIKIEGLDLINMSIINKVIPVNNILHQPLKVWHRNGLLRLDNPFEDRSNLTLYTISGEVIGEFSISGTGNHTIPFTPLNGIYVARLLGDKSVGTGRFMVID